MSLWIRNAAIATMDRENPAADSAVVVGDFFAYVGSDRGAEAYLQEHPQKDLEVLDCGGAFLMPGFNDSHMHFLHYAKSKLGAVDLRGTKSVGEVVERMKKGLEKYDPASGLWLLGEGWNHDYFADEKRYPAAADLDAVTTEYPLLVMRTCFHIGVLNSKAMELVGIDKAAAEKMGDFAGKNPDGTPNGVVKEHVVDNIKANLPAPDLKTLLDMVLACQKDLFARGITSIQSDDFKYTPDGRAYEMMRLLRDASEDGRLKVRWGEQALLPTKAEIDEFFDRKGCDDSYGNRSFKISTVKLLTDGSLGARTAYMRRPYADDPSTRGLPTYTQEELDALVLKAHENNMPVAMHAIGDGAMEMALGAIERARKAMPYVHPRHGVVHCQITDRRQVERFRELDAIAFIQPIFIDYDMHIVFDRVGKELGSTSYAWKDYIESGVHAPFGTDAPVEDFNPMRGLYCAVTSRDLNGEGPFLPRQILSREQALYGYTAAGAWATRDEDVKGKIKPGMYADFITVDRDLLKCPERDILAATVTATYIGGEKVF
ncbi:amidohydrolase [Pyramidobacter sp.]|uniref:amidohydrolase n=1 Tax=Pyramidobacter sp. TaxID=1943581 RepID=UPI0025FCA9F9|nr:amidohydrolase family protein [Pyramidobacter sp.]MCI7404570.1 amidohydrolase [Pyramidobacter sp.]MDY3213303.1 amidohydrolase family protein [Pyramidobacter sp.]